MIEKNELLLQLEEAGRSHGHICPSLFYGVSLALKVKEWLRQGGYSPRELILEGKSGCIRDGVQAVFGKEAALNLRNTGKCALTAVCSSKHTFRVDILSSVRLQVNELHRAYPLEEFQRRGVAYLKTLSEDELFEKPSAYDNGPG